MREYGPTVDIEGLLRNRLLRTAGLALGATIALFALFGVTGVGGFRGGWLWAPTITAAAAGAVGWLGWGPRRGRTAVVGAFVASGVAIGWWVAGVSNLSHGRLRAELDSITMPTEFERIDDDPGGASLCFDVCLNYGRTWFAPGSHEEVRALVADVLRRHRFSLGPWRTDTGDGTVVATGHRGRLGLLVTTRPAQSWDVVDGDAVPAERVEVTVVLDTYS